MATSTEPSVVEISTPGHSISVSTHGHNGLVDSWAECSCGWRGTTHRNVAMVLAGSFGARRDGAAHAAQFKAPEQPPTAEQATQTITNPAEQMQAFTDYLNRPVFQGLSPAEVLGPEKAAELRHVALYRAKRAEWLQAQHDGVVAEKALIAAKRAAREARDVCAAAAQHVDDTRAAIDNLQGELLALVKDGA